MVKRGQAVRRSPTRSKVPTKPKRAPGGVDLKKENAALRLELAEALERQTATSEVLQVISSTPGNLEPVFQSLLENATRVCGAKFGTMGLVEGNDIRLVARYNVPPAFADALGQSRTFRPHPKGGLGQVIKTKQVAHIADLRTNPGYLEGDPSIVAISNLGGARTIVTVPMLKEGELIGAISIFRQEVKPFTDKQIALVSDFANQALIAIENTRLLKELRQSNDDLSESLEQQTATSEVLKIISSTPGELSSVFQTMLANATRICEANFGMMYRYDNGAFHPAALLNVPPALAKYVQDRGSFLPPSGTPLDRLFQTREVTYTADETAESNPGVPARLGGARSLVGVPMLKENELVGAIIIYRQEVRPFTDRQVELVRSFASQAVIAIENTRLLRELRESLQQQTATADVLKVISRSAFDLQAVFNTVARSALELCAADGCALFLRESDLLCARGVWGMDDEFAKLLRDNPVQINMDSHMGRVVLTGRVANIANFAKSNSKLRKFYNFRPFNSFLAVPLMREDQTVGVFTIYRDQAGGFTERQLELVKTFADQAAIAVENVRLFDEVQAKTRDLTEALTYQTGSSNILKVIASSPTDVGPVLNAIVESACELCEAYDAVVRLRDGDDLRFSAHHGPIPVGVERRPIDRNWVSGRSAIDKVPIHVHDLPSAEGDEFPEAQRTPRGIRTILSAPLLREGESIGVIINFTRTEVNPFTDKQIALLQTFADQAVIALDNVRLFEQVQAKTRDLSEALTYQTGSSNILRVIASSPTDVKPVLKAIVEIACELCEANDAIVALKDDDDLLFQEQHGSIPVVWDRRLINRQWTAGRAVVDCKPVHVHDLSAEGEEFPEGREIARRDHVRTVLSVPLLRENESIGAIMLRRTEVQPFSDKQIALLQTFSDQAVIAIGNVRMFEQVQERTKELSISLDELRTAQDRLIQTEKLASLGQLTAGIAHEIKNPLNFVNNFSALSVELVDELDDVLKPATLDKKTREETSELTQMLKGNLEKVVQHGQRADSIVKNMLLHSREDSGERRSVDLNAIVEDSLNLAYHGARAEKKEFNIRLERSFDPAAGMVDLFPQEITRVLLNLISNGVYAAMKRQSEIGGDGRKPTLAAATKNLGDRVEIRIRDNGGGIAAEVMDKIYILYDQATWRRNRSWSLVEPRHSRQAARRIDRGRYPARRIYRVQGHSSALGSHGQSRGRQMNLLILVVDDEPDVEALFRQQFRRDIRDGRFTMDFAQSGDSALQLISDAAIRN